MGGKEVVTFPVRFAFSTGKAAVGLAFDLMPSPPLPGSPQHIANRIRRERPMHEVALGEAALKKADDVHADFLRKGLEPDSSEYLSGMRQLKPLRQFGYHKIVMGIAEAKQNFSCSAEELRNLARLALHHGVDPHYALRADTDSKAASETAEHVVTVITEFGPQMPNDQL